MELLYHYIWHHGMLGSEFKDLQGNRIIVKNPGRHNNDAGPDFSNARLCINGREWCGNVEIHVKASDWYRHGHDKDDAYDNVILHVVALDDARILRSTGEEIPQVSVILPRQFYITYSELDQDLKSIRCSAHLPSLPHIVREDWIDTLTIERLHFKAARLIEYNEQTKGDWEQAVFILLARGLGFGLNGLPFEILAKNLPLRIIYHHADNLMQIEALIFGQAGMLDPTNHLFDSYYQTLCAEYSFLVKKYGLRPINFSLWKYARTRPQNFPHRRLALLTKILYDGMRFSSDLIEAAGDYDKLYELFGWQTSGYWQNHLSFGNEEAEPQLTQSLSGASRNLLMINVAAPFYMAHAQNTGNYDEGELALDILRRIPAEKNYKIRNWISFGIQPKDAAGSQALLHLRDEYCDKGRCLECRYGHHFLRREAKLQISRHEHPDLNNMELVGNPTIMESLKPEV